MVVLCKDSTTLQVWLNLCYKKETFFNKMPP